MKRIFVAVCDDDRDMMELIAGSIRAAFVKQGVTPELYLFYSARAFCEKAKKQPFDLLFLDIQMPGEDGIALAGQLRRAHSRTRVIFVSSREDQVFEALRERPFAFVRKSHFLDDLMDAVNSYLKDYEAPPDDSHWIALQQKSGILRVDPDDVIYIESSGKNQMLYRRSQPDPVPVHATLDSLTEVFAPRGFLRVHKGFLVNHRYICAIQTSDILLTTGQRIPFSRRRAQEIKAQYLSALRQEGTLLL